jgi:hypothetical protein
MKESVKKFTTHQSFTFVEYLDHKTGEVRIFDLEAELNINRFPGDPEEVEDITFLLLQERLEDGRVRDWELEELDLELQNWLCDYVSEV